MAKRPRVRGANVLLLHRAPQIVEWVQAGDLPRMLARQPKLDGRKLSQRFDYVVQQRVSNAQAVGPWCDVVFAVASPTARAEADAMFGPFDHDRRLIERVVIEAILAGGA